MTAAEKDEHCLPCAKSAKMDAIDARTSVLIEEGFEFPPGSGQVFSLSPEMQRTLEGLNQERGSPEVTYPIEWNYKDNSGKILLTDPDMVRSFYLTAVGTVRARRDRGTALKDQVRAATTFLEMELLSDPR
jgi:hypothetical protein